MWCLITLDLAPPREGVRLERFAVVLFRFVLQVENPCEGWSKFLFGFRSGNPCEGWIVGVDLRQDTRVRVGFYWI